MSIAAKPYAWPYDGELNLPGTGLLLVGPQQSLARFDPTGGHAARCRELLATARASGLRVVFVRFARSPATPSALAGLVPEGDVYLPGLEPAVGDLVVEAPALDGCYATGLSVALRMAGLTHLAVAGFGLEAGVHSTLRTLNDLGFECLLLADACAPVDPALQASALKTVTLSGGIFGAVATTDEILEVLR